MTMLTLKRRPNGVPALFNTFEDFFGSTFPERFFGNQYTPSVNVSENEKSFVLEFAVPGFDKKDFSVDIEKDYIKVSGKKEMSTETKEKNYTRREFSAGSFERMFTLPENVDSEKIEAAYDNGILHLTLPKKEVNAENGTKKIEIR